MSIEVRWNPPFDRACFKCRSYQANIRHEVGGFAWYVCLDCLKQIRVELKQAYKDADKLRLEHKGG